MSGRWPFTGRVAELERIGRLLARGRGVVLAGPAGVGKSWLAARAAGDLPSRSAVLRVRASQAARQLPLGAFAPLLGPETPDANVLGWAAAEVLARGSGRPMVVLVDDGHLLDHSSAALVYQLAATVPVLVTLRSGEQCPDAVTALWKDDLAERLEVEPLSRDEIASTVATVLGGQVEGATLDRLSALSQGNLLYLRELVTDALDAGTLAIAGDWWQWRGSPRISGRLAELIAGRIGTLGDTERKLLELTALGEPIGAAILEALCSGEALEAMEERQIVEVGRDGKREMVRLAHPLYGEAVRSACPAVRTRRRYRELAAAVEATGACRREDELRLALWRLESGALYDAGPLLAACKRAWAAHDYELAQRFGWAAYHAGGGAEAALILATVLRYADEYAEAERVLASVRDLEIEDERTRTLLTLTRAQGLAWGGLGRSEEADRLLDELEPVLAEVRNRQEIVVLRGVLAGWRGQYPLAFGLSGQVLAEPWSVPLWAQAMLIRAWAEAHTGRCLDAVATAEEALARRDEWLEAVPPIMGSFHAAVVDAYRLAGDLDGFEAAIERSRAAVLEGGSWDRAMYHDRMVRGIALRLRGRVAQAVQAIGEVVTSSKVEGFATVSPVELAIAAAQAGATVIAEEAMARVEAVSARSAAFVFVPELARHWIAVARGQLTEAVEVAVAAAERLADLGASSAELTVLHDVVRLGGAPRAVGRLSELAARCQGALPAVYAAHARAASDADAPALDAVAQRFERLGFELHAAEAFAQASRAFDAAGLGASARSSASKAAALAARCDGARTPALARLRTPSLTNRELEIATLAASGLTSRQIAERLVVSVRTVDNHLRSAYEKLGVSGRAELRGVLPG